MKVIVILVAFLASCPLAVTAYGSPSGVGALQCLAVPDFIKCIGEPQVYGVLEAYVDGYMSAKDVDLHEIQPRIAMRKVLDICEVAPQATFDQACAIYASQHHR